MELAIGLSTMVTIGPQHFRDQLACMHAMDGYLHPAPVQQNIPTTGKAPTPSHQSTLVTIDLKAAFKNRRIIGTLPRRGHVHPIPLRDENLPSEKPGESQVAVQHTDSGKDDGKGAPGLSGRVTLSGRPGVKLGCSCR